MQQSFGHHDAHLAITLTLVFAFVVCLCLSLCSVPIVAYLAVTLDGEDKVLARSSPHIDVRRRLLVKVARVHYCPVQ